MAVDLLDRQVTPVGGHRLGRRRVVGVGRGLARLRRLLGVGGVRDQLSLVGDITVVTGGDDLTLEDGLDGLARSRLELAQTNLGEGHRHGLTVGVHPVVAGVHHSSVKLDVRGGHLAQVRVQGVLELEVLVVGLGVQLRQGRGDREADLGTHGVAVDLLVLDGLGDLDLLVLGVDVDVVDPVTLLARCGVRGGDGDNEGLGLLNDVAGGLGLAHEICLDRHAADGCRTGGIRVRRRHPRLEAVAVQLGVGRVCAGAVRNGSGR